MKLNSTKEMEILDDISRRTEEIAERIDLLDKPVRVLPSWMNNHKQNIDKLFASHSQLLSWIATGWYDQVEYDLAARGMLKFLQDFYKEIEFNRRLMWGDVRDTTRAAKLLIAIENGEIVLSSDPIIRKDVLGELARVRDCERRFNNIIGSLRLYVLKMREIRDDMNGEMEVLKRFVKEQNLANLKENTRMGKIEHDVDYIMRVICPSQGNVQENFFFIKNTLYMLRSHVEALKRGAKFVTSANAA